MPIPKGTPKNRLPPRSPNDINASREMSLQERYGTVTKDQAIFIESIIEHAIEKHLAPWFAEYRTARQVNKLLSEQNRKLKVEVQSLKHQVEQLAETVSEKAEEWDD